jgi:hypothetical protein
MNKLQVVILWMISTFLYAQKIEFNAEFIEELEKKKHKLDSYISEYELVGKKGELHAVMGRGNNRQLFMKLTNKATGTIDGQVWSADGKRIFMIVDGETVCVNDAFLIFEAIFQLESAFTGNALTHKVENYFYLEKESLCFGLHCTTNLSSVFKKIESDQSTTIEKMNGGMVRFTNDEIGTIVIDSADASIFEQDIQERTMKRIRHETKNAADEVNQIVSKFEPGPFKVMSLDQAFPYVRAIACATCQSILDRIDKDELSLKTMTESLAKNELVLSDNIIPILIKSKEHILSNERVDKLRDFVTAGLEKHMLEKGVKPEKIKSYFHSEKVHQTLEDSMTKATTKVVNDAGEMARHRIINIILDGELSAKTEVAKQAMKEMTDALIRNYIKSTVQDSIKRYKRNLTMD